MTVVIAFRPDNDEGHKILDELENRFDLWPQRLEDGTRRYQLDAESADVDALDPKLDAIDPDWRDHVSRP